MLSDLVHEFDDNLLAIVKTGKMLRTARKMEGKCEKDEVGTLAQDSSTRLKKLTSTRPKTSWYVFGS
jgi:hypothetical protein